MNDVSAGPNRSEITARVKRVEQSPSSPGKWYVIVDILSARPIEGGQFARAGSEGRVFTFDERAPLEPGDVFDGEVEYLGGARAGEFQLHRLISRHVETPPPD